LDPHVLKVESTWFRKLYPIKPIRKEDKSLFLLKRCCMGVAELKTELHNYIDHADERFLKMVYAMSLEYKAPAVIGYHVDGSPITRKELAHRVGSASKRVKSGNFISQEEVEKEVEKEVENW
jgi:hypothetical protein